MKKRKEQKKNLECDATGYVNTVVLRLENGRILNI